MLVALAWPASAQNLTPPTPPQKGTFYFFWGYNRNTYSRSDIRFVNHTSDNYDFVLHNAKAHERTDMDRYWQIVRLTIPQYDFSLGYWFKNKKNLGVELSWNHSKYIVNDNQVMHLTGDIRGKHYDLDTLVTPNFVHMQHTNGNNYLMANLSKRIRFAKWKFMEFDAMGKVGAGPMISYSISTVLNSTNPGRFHFDGIVVGTSAGLRVTMWKYFYLHTEVQGALADYFNVEIGADRKGRSYQHFYSLSWIWGGGLNFPL